MTNLDLLCGDALKVLPGLALGSIQCCVTSPPYWGLRDYGTASWEGGDAGCEHLGVKHVSDGSTKTNDAGNAFRNGSKYVDHILDGQAFAVCKCGARRIDSQLGLESTPELYVENMVRVFREVWRVLRDDGTCWINLGDSYNANQGVGFDTHNDGGIRKALAASPKMTSGLRPKNLVGIPWRVAFALQADGWYLRSDIIWHKPNPMPESVTDRPTKAHEYIFLLTKRERYFYDANAIKEKAIVGENLLSWDERKQLGEAPRRGYSQNGYSSIGNDSGLRNKRDVWTVATQPYAEAHFATFPEDLIKPCILAGSRLGDTILDPFAGSGTTGKVALELGRKAILIELNPDYIELARIRTHVTPGFL